MIEEHVPVAAGVRLHVLRWPGPERPYLLVHGLSSNARVWAGTAARLSAAGHQVVAVDLRGHGESDVPPDGYDTETAAADLGALVAALELGEPVVAGQSWGGNVVLEYATRYPLHGLAMLDGGWLHLADQFPDPDSAWKVLAPPRLNGMRMSDFHARLRAAHPDWPESGILGTLGNLVELPDGTARARLSRDHHESIVRSMWRSRPRDRYPLVRVPTLLMPAVREGDQHSERSRKLVEEAAATIPDATVAWYEDADHDLHAQYPDRVASDLLGLA
jgi:pimeloyl-ACP methyl ester carboxylesterase